ncbi:lipopolysaccharide export system permease protein [Hasllibacter halocynthiae]|uniref:Lipopolysaccharide export system permease protein n=1 Tax=Hasllibacter halocynthiae TaxID=595589 RepID=A0A2T0X7Q0_9RHOB|nr:LPS export ABC transporter permease LptG [Hasllibacter halocynthiae]PRY94956.1 lipopolysaccharide export system permease protein [Hasllibacter halocynthiae]
MTLSLYLARREATALLATLGIFAALLGLVDLVEQVRRFDDRAFGETARLALLNLPALLHEVLPLVALLGTLSLSLGLARSSEWVVIRAAGRSLVRALLAPALVALALGALAVAILNPVVSATMVRAEAVVADWNAEGRSVLTLSGDGIWLRQGTADGQTVIRAARASLDGTQLAGASFVTFRPGEGPVLRIDAARASLAEGHWSLEDVRRWDLRVPNPEAAASSMPEGRIPTDLTAQQIRDSFGAPASVPIWQLPGFIADLERAGFSALQHRMHLWSELTLPLFLVAMALIGAAFTMRQQRGGRTGIFVGAALVSGFALYFVRNFAAVLGAGGEIPIPFAALAPPVAAILAGLGLVLDREDG